MKKRKYKKIAILLAIFMAWMVFAGGCVKEKCIHAWQEGICISCQEECTHVWDDGVCSTCESVCQHTWKEGKCGNCSLVCEHIWEDNLVCKTCALTLDTNVQRLPCKSENGNIFGLMYLPSIYHGKLKTVIISHGFNVRASNGMATLLAKRGYACYIFDYCGGCPTTRSDMKMEDMTILTEKADLLAVYDMVKELPYVDREQIFLYGESQGGLITALVAAELREEIAGIVLMYPGFSMLSDLAFKYGTLSNVPAYVEILKCSMKKKYVEDLFTFLPKNYQPISVEGEKEIKKASLALTQNLYEQIATYEGEVLIFHGTEDSLVDIDFSKEAIKYYENATLISVKGQGHVFDHIHFNATASQIHLFLKELKGI